MVHIHDGETNISISLFFVRHFNFIMQVRLFSFKEVLSTEMYIYLNSDRARCGVYSVGKETMPSSQWDHHRVYRYVQLHVGVQNKTWWTLTVPLCKIYSRYSNRKRGTKALFSTEKAVIQ
jgi:hypothetical protein